MLNMIIFIKNHESFYAFFKLNSVIKLNTQVTIAWILEKIN